MLVPKLPEVTICPGCGRPVDQVGRPKKYHNDRCRAKFWDAVNKIDLHVKMIQEYLDAWKLIAETGEESVHLAAALNQIEESLLDCRAVLNGSAQAVLLDL